MDSHLSHLSQYHQSHLPIISQTIDMGLIVMSQKSGITKESKGLSLKPGKQKRILILACRLINKFSGDLFAVWETGRKLGLEVYSIVLSQILHFSCSYSKTKFSKIKLHTVFGSPSPTHLKKRCVKFGIQQRKYEIQYLPPQEGMNQIRETKLPKTIKSV